MGIEVVLDIVNQSAIQPKRAEFRLKLANVANIRLRKHLAVHFRTTIYHIDHYETGPQLLSHYVTPLRDLGDSHTKPTSTCST